MLLIFDFDPFNNQISKIDHLHHPVVQKYSLLDIFLINPIPYDSDEAGAELGSMLREAKNQGDLLI